MHQDNIDKIMSSKLWKKIKKNPNFIESHIVRTEGNSLGFRALIVFFNWRMYDGVIKRYWTEGRNMSKGEALDNYCGDYPRFYGMKLLVFS